MTISRSKQLELEYEREYALERLESILSDSPPLLREKIAWIRNTFEEEWRHSIMSRYQVALVIRDIYDDVTDNKGSVYGAKAVEAIKKAFGWDNSVIYQTLHVADAFTPEQIEEITQMRLPGGRPLTFGHVVALSRVDDDRHREKLLKTTVKEGWTTRKLSNAVDVVAHPEPVKAQDRRGRPLARPRDFDAVLDQQAHFAQDFLGRNSQVWSHPEHSLSAKVQDLDTADFTPDRADRLKRHAELMSLLSEKAKMRADEASHVHAGFTKVLKQQAEGQTRPGRTRPPARAAPE
jgi:hypothetical protein